MPITQAPRTYIVILSYHNINMYYSVTAPSYLGIGRILPPDLADRIRLAMRGACSGYDSGGDRPFLQGAEATMIPHWRCTWGPGQGLLYREGALLEPLGTQMAWKLPSIDQVGWRLFFKLGHFIQLFTMAYFKLI